MATVINALEDQIKIGQGFVSGKDQISVNDQVVFEGKLGEFKSQKVEAGNRTYEIRQEVTNATTRATAIHLHIYENEEEVHSGFYDQKGQRISDPSKAGSPQAARTCAKVGAAFGIVFALGLSFLFNFLSDSSIISDFFPESLLLGDAVMTGVLEGALMGSLGGLFGGAIGFGFGEIVFGSDLS